MASSSTMYESFHSIPYGSPTTASRLKTLDYHKPTEGSTKEGPFWIVFVHGGGFRDPLQTSKDIEPTLPHLCKDTETWSHVAGVVSLNYRLCPYPDHPTQPSDPTDEARNVHWPLMYEDVCEAVGWLQGMDADNGPRDGSGGSGSGGLKGIMKGQPFILVGQSVGGTMATLAGLRKGSRDQTTTDDDESLLWNNLTTAISLEGVYDFRRMRDNHLSSPYLHVYESFITGAFGPEADGGWDRNDGANLVRVVRDRQRCLRDGVRLLVLGHSRTDELVEFEQVERMAGAFKEVGEGGRVKVVEAKGGHDEIVWDGTEVARVVGEVVGILLAEKDRGGVN